MMRGPMRRKGHLVDLVALGGLAGLAALTWYLHIVTPEGTADPWLFRGGFFVCGLATLGLIAGVTHRGAWAGRLLGNPLLLWIGLRSYGIYLFHWPIYQGIRGVAGRPLTVAEFVLALAITFVVCDISYRFIEMPIRRRHVGRWWRRLQAARDPVPRRVIAAVGAACVALSVFAAANLATAELKPNEIAAVARPGAARRSPTWARSRRPPPRPPLPERRLRRRRRPPSPRRRPRRACRVRSSVRRRSTTPRRRHRRRPLRPPPPLWIRSRPSPSATR